MFTVSELQNALVQGRLRITHHAKQAMWEDQLSVDEIFHALLEDTAEIIEAYPTPQGRPYPMALLLSRLPNAKPLHLVVAYNTEQRLVILVTVYRPDPNRWDASFRQREP